MVAACDVVRLALRLSPDGRIATLVDAPHSEAVSFLSRDNDAILGCEAGRAAVSKLARDADPPARRRQELTARSDRALADRACAGLGRYVWRGGQFTYERAPLRLR